MSRLSSLRVVDPVLTNLAIGYSNTQTVGEVLCPFVEVEKEAGKIPKFGKEAFKIYNTERALRAKSNRINPENFVHVDVNTDEHDLEYPIDYRESAEAAFPLQAHATNVVTEGINLRREKQIADLAQNPANYADGNKVILANGFKDPALDVIGVFDEAKSAIRKKIGRKPNTLVLSDDVYYDLRRHPQLIELNKYTKRGLLSTQDLADILEVETVVVAESIYSDDSDEFHDFWQGSAVMAYVAKKPANADRNIYEPSYGYTIRRKGYPFVDTRTEDGKLELIRNTDNFRPYIVGADAGYLIKVA